MEIFLPMSWLLLGCIVTTLTAIVAVAPRACGRNVSRRTLGAGSMLAGAGWFATYLLLAAPTWGQDGATPSAAAGEAAPAPVPAPVPAPASTPAQPATSPTPEPRPEPAPAAAPAEAQPAATNAEEAKPVSSDVKAKEASSEAGPTTTDAAPAAKPLVAAEASPAASPAAAPQAEAPPTAEAPEPPSAKSEGVRTLSVAPRDAVGGARFDRERRPVWVEAPSNHVGAVHTTSIASGAWLSPDEGRRALDDLALRATREYVAELVHHPRAELLADTYDLPYVKSRVLKRENMYEEQIEGELSGSSYQAHALLEFDAGFRDEALRRWREIVTRMRLLQSGLGLGGILLVVSLLYGLLRADTATRGYYTRTLQWVAAVAILGVVAAGVLLAKNIPWL